jgi:hypothetical protein
MVWPCPPSGAKQTSIIPGFTSAFDPTRTSGDVRFRAAIRGVADIERTNLVRALRLQLALVFGSGR